MSMNLSDHVAPKSDQLDAVDLIQGHRIFTVESVTGGAPDQPFNFHLAEFPRPWRPGLSMRRVLLGCWGDDVTTFTGRRVELYCDPSVEFGGKSVGGIRVSRLSHISKRKAVPLLVSRGKSAMWTVEPLPDAAPASPVVSNETLIALDALFEEAQIPDDARLAGVNAIIRGAATALEVLTEDQAQTVLASLRKKVGR